MLQEDFGRVSGAPRGLWQLRPGSSALRLPERCAQPGHRGQLAATGVEQAAFFGTMSLTGERARGHCSAGARVSSGMRRFLRFPGVGFCRAMRRSSPRPWVALRGPSCYCSDHRIARFASALLCRGVLMHFHFRPGWGGGVWAFLMLSASLKLPSASAAAASASRRAHSLPLLYSHLGAAAAPCAPITYVPCSVARRRARPAQALRISALRPPCDGAGYLRLHACSGSPFTGWALVCDPAATRARTGANDKFNSQSSDLLRA